MGKSTKFADLYLRFIQLAEALRNLPTLPPLEPLEERILMIVANAHHTQQRLSVKDLMGIDFTRDVAWPAEVNAGKGLDLPGRHRRCAPQAARPDACSNDLLRQGGTLHDESRERAGLSR